MDDGPKASTSYSSYEEVTRLSVRQRTYPAGLPYAVDDESCRSSCLAAYRTKVPRRVARHTVGAPSGVRLAEQAAKQVGGTFRWWRIIDSDAKEQPASPGRKHKAHGIRANDEKTWRTDGFPCFGSGRVVPGYDLFDFERQTQDAAGERDSGAERATIFLVHGDVHTGTSHLPRRFSHMS